jgi:hypothetical protein
MVCIKADMLGAHPVRMHMNVRRYEIRGSVRLKSAESFRLGR